MIALTLRGEVMSPECRPAVVDQASYEPHYPPERVL